MKATYKDHMGSDLSVVNAARVSFNKESEWSKEDGHLSDFYMNPKLSERDSKLINYLARHDHWTPFAHTSITLHMKAPVFIRTQCFKHKAGFVENEVSRRYVDDEPEFFTPEVWRKRAENKKQGSSEEPALASKGYFYTEFKDNDKEAPYAYQVGTDQTLPEVLDWYYKRCESFYYDLLNKEVCPEQARMVLPQSMYTEWYWTGSLAAYARFYNQRTDPHAQKEIQDLAKQVGEIIEPLFPVSWKALTTNG